MVSLRTTAEKEGIPYNENKKLLIPVTAAAHSGYKPSSEKRPRKERKIAPGPVTLENMDIAVVDKFLGKRYGCREMEWTGAHRSFVESMRADGNERLVGAVYPKHDCLAATGIIKPYLEDTYGDMRGLIQDSPISTLVYLGDQTLPHSQEDRRILMKERIESAKHVIIYIGGLLENRLSLESIMSQLLSGLYQQEDFVAFGITHSGGEESYLPGVDIAKMDASTELRTILAPIARLLTLTGKTYNDIRFIAGHSKGGWFAEQLANTLLFPNAGIIEWGPAIVGKDVPVDKRGEWLKNDALNPLNPALVQAGIYGGLLNLALHYPDMPPREFAIKIVGPWIAEHFVGRHAFEKNDAIYTILTELLFNRHAIIGQQHSLAHMHTIVESLDQMSPNLRFVAAAGQDDTLEYQFQLEWYRQVLDRQPDFMRVALQEISEKAASSEHNINFGVYNNTLAWMRLFQQSTMNMRPVSPGPSTEHKLSDAQINNILDNRISNY